VAHSFVNLNNLGGRKKEAMVLVYQMEKYDGLEADENHAVR
jgi:hypothetical protein